MSSTSRNFTANNLFIFCKHNHYHHRHRQGRSCQVISSSNSKSTVNIRFHCYRPKYYFPFSFQKICIFIHEITLPKYDFISSKETYILKPQEYPINYYDKYFIYFLPPLLLCAVSTIINCFKCPHKCPFFFLHLISSHLYNKVQSNVACFTRNFFSAACTERASHGLTED